MFMKVTASACPTSKEFRFKLFCPNKGCIPE